MPSPIGHVLAGVAVALAGQRRPTTEGVWPFLTRPLTLWCIALAALPDADLLLTGFHRRATHSVGATILVIIVATVVTGWVTRANSPPKGGHDVLRKSPPKGGHYVLAVTVLCAAAHLSHLLTDWLGADWFAPPGIQALWPFSDRWFISGWDVFARVERRNPFSAATMVSNVWAAAREIAIMGAVVMAVWWIRGRKSG